MKLGNRKNKITEFNQSEIIQNLNGILDENQYNSIRNGICYMLSMEWLRLFVIGPSGLPNFAPNNEIEYYKMIALDYITYSGFIKYANIIIDPSEFKKDPILRADVYANLDKELGENCSNGKLKFKSFFNITNCDNFISNISAINKYALFRFDWLDKDNKNVAHMTAFIRIDGVLYFFDPNFGIFKIYSPDMNISEEEALRTLFDDIKETYNEGNEFCYGQISYN